MSGKFVCSEGDDCPCHTAEKSRPVPKPATAPQKITLEPGKTAYICMCGQSAKFPYCDGAHSKYNAEHGTALGPMPIKNETDAPKDYWLCMCGHSKKRPFCDGSHSKVREVSD